eukprot:gnl/MRDRNA2_/MRDRNA2_118936_c0_seq1.p1 gnl/MRDRNA2_/MRDRNA2_118936_c0~~gnl/MRDRNA2_/MRDRNA2_118936_c0_seq1.p1  ORF type:complete len:657 (+),score=132.96 gnl/MRDRNA2_/MRDRNA2_118936_c0_seq1:66-2036(+)
MASGSSVVLKVLGIVPARRLELEAVPDSIDALDDAALGLAASFGSRPYRLLVDGRKIRDEDLEGARQSRECLIVHVEPLGATQTNNGFLGGMQGEHACNGASVSQPNSGIPTPGRNSHGSASGESSREKKDGDVSVHALLEACRSRGLSTQGCLEKSDLEQLLLEASCSKTSARSSGSPSDSEIPECAAEDCMAASPADAGWNASSPRSVKRSSPVDDVGNPSSPGSDEHSSKDLCHKRITRWRRGKEAAFHEFVLCRPFQDTRWHVKVLIAGASYLDASRDVILKTARQVGALEPTLDGSEMQILQRLGRLEARIGGKGVHEGESHNALRLFERELTRANWTRDTFERLKRQLDGQESCQAADVVVETSICWARSEKNMRRTPWFIAACERIAAPLGLAWGHHNSGNGFDGCVFVGPLTTALGAALTAALVFHLGHVEFESTHRAKASGVKDQPCFSDDDSDKDLNGKSQKRATPTQRKQKPKNINPFLQGFVDGALTEERAKIWTKMLTLPEEKASKFIQKQQDRGFFNDVRATEEEPEDVGCVISGIFDAGNLDLEPTSSSKQSAPPSDDSFSLIVVGNVRTLRRSLHRNEEASVKQYHWGCRSLSTLQSRAHDGASYNLGKAAGAKRSAEVDKVRSGASRGTAKRARALTNQ